MELKDIKALQDMGFSLDEIKAVYYPDTQAESSAKPDAAAADPAPETAGSEPAPAAIAEPSKKKRFFRLLQIFGKKDR